MSEKDFRHPNRVAALRSLIQEQEIDAMLISDPHNRRYLVRVHWNGRIPLRH